MVFNIVNQSLEKNAGQNKIKFTQKRKVSEKEVSCKITKLVKATHKSVTPVPPDPPSN